jgi:hypothetical protein
LVILSVFDVQLCSSGGGGDDRGGGGDDRGGGGDDRGGGGDDRGGGGDRLRLQMQVGYQLLDLTQTVILLLQLLQC